jgi:hypothetical protein
LRGQRDGRNIEFDAIFMVLNRNGSVQIAALRHRDRDLATGQKACRAARANQQRRLGQQLR